MRHLYAREATGSRTPEQLRMKPSQSPSIPAANHPDDLLAAGEEIDRLVQALAETVDDASSVSEAAAQRICELEAEVEALRAELAIHKRRDQTLKYFMQQFDEEQRLAARLQQDFLPKSLPQVGRVHVNCLFRPASYVSGDFYDVMRLDEQHIGFFIADAVGHGMPAALLSMYIKRALITKEIHPGGYRLLLPGESLGLINEALVEQNLSAATFATALYGYINVNTLQVTFARAGHPSPILITRDGAVRTLDSDGGLLGIFPDEQFSDGSATMQPGDRLFVFTDGIEVAFSGDETIDTDRWRQELYNRRHLNGHDLLIDLQHHLDRESGSLAPKDDLTMIVIEVADH